MVETAAPSIHIPFNVAQQVMLGDVPIAALKVFLAIESLRTPGGERVVLPVKRLRDITGLRSDSFFRSIDNLSALRARWRHVQGMGGDPVTVWQEIPRCVPHGDTVEQDFVGRFHRDWLLAADRGGYPVSIPLEELRGFKKRAALLMRLRAGSAVVKVPRAKYRVDAVDLGMFTGFMGDHLQPNTHVYDYVEPALPDLRSVAETVAVEYWGTAGSSSGYIRTGELRVSRNTLRRAPTGTLHVGERARRKAAEERAKRPTVSGWVPSGHLGSA